MVETLLSAAAAESLFDDELSSSNEEGVVIIKHEQPPHRFCEFCNSSNTPTWRRGPAGKGSLCNACGIKWRLRKRSKKNEKGSPPPSPSPTLITPEKEKKVRRHSQSQSQSPQSAVTRPPKKRKEYHPSPDPHVGRQLVIRESDVYKSRSESVDNELYSPTRQSSSHNKRKKYYCKYCDQTFSLSQFRNSQQFGAHCSNCSRRPRLEEDVDGLYEYRDYSSDISPISVDTSSPESPPPLTPAHTTSGNNRDGLLLRLLHVVEHQLVDVHELAEIRDELTTLRGELLSREEARKSELSLISTRFQEDMDSLKKGLRRTVAAHEQLAAHRLMEMEQAIRIRGGKPC